METTARYFWVGLFTLIVILTGMGFIYWLHHNEGLTARTFYQVRFEGPVSGLQPGSSVQFNGLRVGEVTSLKLDAADPSKVVAMIAVAADTPIRLDTNVGIDFPGLSGSPQIALRGGTLTAPVLRGSESDPPVLTADETAGQDVMQAARAALQKLNKILGDNSSQIDGIFKGLEHFVGGGAGDKPKPVYDITLAAPASKPGKAPNAQITVAEPSASVTLQTQRMLSRSSEGQILPQGDAQWADSLPKLLQQKIIQNFENNGFLASVIPSMDQSKPNYQLVVDLRNFASVTAPKPAADLEFSVKIMAEDGHIADARLFHVSVPVTGDEPQAIVAAFNTAFNQALSDLVSWASKTVAG